MHELAISHDHALAYVPLYGAGIYGNNTQPNNKILVIDLARRALADVISLGEYVAPHGMVTTGDGKLWVVCDIPRKLLLLDPARRAIEAAYDAPPKGPHLLSAHPDGTKLYISAKEGDITVFDTGTRKFTAGISVRTAGTESGNGSGTEGLTPTPDGRHLIAIDNERGDLRVIDTATNREIDRVPLMLQALTNSKRSRLAKLMFSPDGRTLVVTAYTGGNCWLIDPADLRRQILVPLAKGPMGIAFPPDGASVIVSSHDSGLLTRIDLAMKRAVAAYDGGSGIEVMAFY